MLGCAVLFHGAETLADLAEIDIATLLEQSGLGETAGDLEFIAAAEALRGEIQIGREFAGVLEGLDERRRIIARRRTYARVPDKLAVLGKEFGVSRERGAPAGGQAAVGGGEGLGAHRRQGGGTV